MTLDSGAEPPIITKNIVDRTKDKIDKSEKHDLSGVATVPIESIGIVRNLPITLAPGCIIYEDFVVVDYHKPTLIFSNQLLKKYGCAVDWATNELKIPLNGKDYIIPVTMHKIKNKLEQLSRKKKAMTNVYTLKNINNKDNDSFKGVGQRLGGTYEQEFKEKLYSTIKSKAEINDLSEKLVDKYNEREKEFENKASQLIASTTKVRSQLISERKSHTESQLRELEGKLDDLKLEQVLHDSNAVGGLLEEPVQTDPKEIDSLRLELEQIKEDLNSKEYEIECMEKGKESSDSMYKREIDILSSGRLKLIDENRSLRDQLASKKNNEVDTPPPPMNDSSQLDPEGTLSTFNPSSQIISVGGAEAVSLPVTAPIIASSSMSSMLIYSILTLVLITIIYFMVRKWRNSQKKSNQFFTYENYINREHRPDFYYLKS
ncbi:hypothetical protein GLOIN_2v1763802 [Rhizophagus irregularis DAOM 181602=DAOM 197198]|nr:hypothetical protein GLOIN_2v1763802 [Rhizophagus irregularis DAOM 181602=DAOM 197198]